MFFTDDIEYEDDMIDLYHEILQRTENSINDIVQYASVSVPIYCDTLRNHYFTSFHIELKYFIPVKFSKQYYIIMMAS